MQRIVVISQKGGVGKTTIATNLAVCLSDAGYKTALLDYDELGGSLTWGNLRADRAPIIHVSNINSGHHGIRSWGFHIPPDTQRLVVDAPGNIKGFELQDLVLRADLLVVPTLPSKLDLAVTRAFLDRVSVLCRARHGRELPIGVVLNRLRRHTISGREAEQAVVSSGWVFAARFADTQMYTRATGAGLGILELREPRAKAHQKHWQRLLNWIGQFNATDSPPEAQGADESRQF